MIDKRKIQNSQHMHLRNMNALIDCFLKKVTKPLLKLCRGITESVSSCQVMNRKKILTF